MIIKLPRELSRRLAGFRLFTAIVSFSAFSACAELPVEQRQIAQAQPNQPAQNERAEAASPAAKNSPTAAATHAPVVLHVSAQEGSDSARGDAENPLATLQKAISLVRPGGTITLRGGRYPAAEISRAAHPDAWITLAARPGEQVIIEAGESDDYALRLNSVAGSPLYWRLRGLDIRGGRQAALSIDAAHVHLLDSQLQQSRGDLVHIEAAAEEAVLFGNRLKDAAADGVRLRGAARAWLLANSFAAIEGAAISVEQSGGELLVERNRVERAAIGVKLSAGSGGLLRNNIFVGGGQCLVAESPVGLDFLHNSCIENSANAAITLDLGESGARVRLLNNLLALADSATRALSLRGEHTAGSALEIDGNLYWHAAGEGRLRFASAAAGLDEADFGQWQRAGFDAAGKIGEPRFDAAASGYGPSAGSAAIGVGLGDVGVAEDYRGVPRGDRLVAGAVALGEESPLQREVQRKQLKRYPYLQSHSAEAVSIAWAVADSSRRSRVRVHDRDGRLVAESVPEAHDLPVDVTGFDFPMRQYRARVDGLQADTEYVFSVVADGRRVVRGLDFKTIPAVGAQRINFIAFGDSGTEYDQPRLVRDKVTERDENGDFRYPHDLVMGVGDLAYYKGNFLNFRQRFFAQMTGWKDRKLENSLLTHRPFISALGNHEYNNKAENLPLAFLTAFDNPLMDGIPEEDAERYFSFDSGPVHFLFIDTMKTAGDLDEQRFPQMRDWIEQDLKNSRQPWKIAFLHHSPLSFGPHGTWGDQRENSLIRKQLLSMMQDLGVQLVMFGHDHMYQRTVPLRFDERGKILRDDSGSIIAEGGVVYVAVGNGGAGIHNRQTQPSTYGSELWQEQRGKWGIGYDFLARRPDGQPVLYDNIAEDSDGPRDPKRRWGFTHVRVDGDKLDVTAYNFFGELMDDFSIVRDQ